VAVAQAVQPGGDTPAQAGPAADWHEQVRAAFAAAGRNTLVDRMGITLVEATAGRVVGTMPVAGNTQPAGVLHGGASCVLAETAGSVGATLHAGPGRIALGVEINASHHRSATEGYVTAVATRLSGGRTLATYDIAITDDQDQRICTARLTCVLRDRA
jgi:1,4-dihydroxy-2-naphthoyl-CoA hydrolase